MSRTTFFSVFLLALLVGVNSSLTDTFTCMLSRNLKNEILGYEDFVENVIKTATEGSYAGKLYADLSSFIEAFGSRLTGTQNLENSIKFLQTKISYAGLKSQKDVIQVPYWARGKEFAKLMSPREKQLRILGLGYSIGTPSAGITADVVVVSNFEELKKKEKEIPGKIVLFNAPYTTYEQTVKYRIEGPSAASKLGAVAALVRSVTPFSIYSPHTGRTRFSGKKLIPAACVTLEDADLLARMYNAGRRVVVHLKMEAIMLGNRTSSNLSFDIEGSTQPKQYVTVSGHIDSWDVGQGALDDGVGAFLALHSLLLLKTMNVPPPKRTIRGILWTAEEQGLIGALAYLEKNKDEIKSWTAALESDSGAYKPLGLNFNGTHRAYCIMREIMLLFESLDATDVKKSASVGSDISVFQPYGVPLLEPLHEPNSYMWFHHTEGDSMRTMNSSDIDKNLAIFSAVSYILANLSTPLPSLRPGPLRETISSFLPGQKPSYTTDIQNLFSSFMEYSKEKILPYTPLSSFT